MSMGLGGTFWACANGTGMSRPAARPARKRALFIGGDIRWKMAWEIDAFPSLSRFPRRVTPFPALAVDTLLRSPQTNRTNQIEQKITKGTKNSSYLAIRSGFAP